MRYFAIFTLFMIACSDEIPNDDCIPFVTISDLNPIQFWQADCDTYNEKEVCGVHHKCWCQPWECDDELVIQFTDPEVSDYSLRVLNEEGDVIDTVPFAVTEFEEDIFADLPFSIWTNEAGPDNNPWTTGTNPNVTFSSEGTSEQSDFLRVPIVIPPGVYTITYTGSFGVVGSLRFMFRNNGLNVGNATRSNIFGNGSVNITVTETTDDFIIYTSIGIASNTNVTFNSISSITITRDPIFTASYTPSLASPSICGEKVRFEIVDNASPDSIVAKSDCIDIQQNHSCTTLIEYSNNRNFAGITFESVSPEVSFKTRVPAIFFHERFPEEDNVIQLTDRMVKTSGTVRSQRLFETDYMPYYMHKKLQLIFKLQTILIDGLEWTKEDAYEIQDGERRWPVKKGKVYLTEKNYLQRAVL